LRRSVAASILLTALAVGMMLAARHFLFTPKNPAEDANSRRFIATLTGTDYCQWGQGTLTTELGSHLKPGTLHLAEGLAEIAFQSGVTVVLEGLSILELQSANRDYLHHGKLAAHVPPAGKGFSIQTPGGTVVDLGTEFGLVARATGQTEVFAFAGIVEVKPKDNTPDNANKQRLTSGQAIRMSSSETRDIAVDSTPFVRRLPIQPKTLPRVLEMRELVSQHPKLIHHYTFEGDRAIGEHLQDSKGDVPLRQVSFGAGSTA